MGLGSNLGDRAARLRDALVALRAAPGTRELRASRTYETRAVGPFPPGPRPGPNLNAVAELYTALALRALLELLLEIEARAGRRRSGARNESRVLDLDLLLHGERCLEEEGLVLPHPRMHERPFVLEPLAELAPELRHPVLGTSVAELAARERDEAAVWLHAPHGDRPAQRAADAPRAMVAVSISPVGEGVSVGRHVAAALRVLQQQDRVRWEPGPMFTTLEGELGEIFELVQRMREAVFELGALRVGTVLKIDERRDRPASMEQKLASLRSALDGTDSPEEG